MPRLTSIQALQLQEEIVTSILHRTWGQKRVFALAKRFRVHPSKIYEHRRRALRRFPDMKPEDVGAERTAILMMLDDVIEDAVKSNKHSAAISGLKLRAEISGVMDTPVTSKAGTTRPESVSDLLETIAQAEALRGQLSAPVVHEDEEE